MMEKPISDQILTWLEQYSFDELTGDQTTAVLKEMSEQDYRAYQVMIGEASVLSGQQNIKAPAAIKHQLDKKLTGQFAPQSRLTKILSAGVPLWLIGLMALGFYLLWNYTDIMKQEPIVIEKIEYEAQLDPQIIYKTDTIFQEVKSEPIVVTKEVIKYIEIEVPTAIDPIDLVASQSELGLREEFDLDETLQSFEGLDAKEVALIPQGKSVADDEALMIFLDEINE